MGALSPFLGRIPWVLTSSSDKGSISIIASIVLPFMPLDYYTEYIFKNLFPVLLILILKGDFL